MKRFNKYITSLLTILMLLTSSGMPIIADDETTDPEIVEVNEDEISEDIVQDLNDNEVIEEIVEEEVNEDVEEDIYVVEIKDNKEIRTEAYPFSQSAQIDDVIITVSAEEGVFPEGATLFVEKVEIKAVDEAIEEARDENKNVAVSYTYDIKVLDQYGNELQPNGKVSVKFSLAEKMQEALSVDVYHIDENMNTEILNTEVSDNIDNKDLNTDVEVETESFSYYTVEFTYNTLQYVLDGDSTIELSTILASIGLSGEVSDVSVSNSNLFNAYQENGVWYVKANQAFDTTEWMKIVIDGIEYEIEVTDAVNSTFYIEAVEDTNIALVMVGSPTIGTVKYGINNSSPSTEYTVSTSSSTIHLTAGQKCYWTITSTTTAFSSSNYLKFTSTGKINAGGNLSSLIGGSTSIPRNYCFSRLFYQCDKLIDASAINFGSITTLANGCYYAMFQNCTSLTTAPELPATTLVNECYYNMFYGCTSLTTAPELPATTLASDCYYSMFVGCTSLTTAPELPATTLASGCYQNMFYGCTSLTTAPELPATTLASYCYQNMFFGCTSLTTAPELPATTLADYCYYSMFENCTSLKISETQTSEYRIPYRIPSEGTGTTGTYSLSEMFSRTGGTFTGTPSINTTYYLWGTTSYTLSIPATVDASAGSVTISYKAIGTDVDVSITSANNWKLKNNTSSLDYSLSETAFTLIEGTGTKNVNISVSGTATLVGKHSDIVTFTYSEPLPLPLTDNYVGYYADVDGDGTADGMIFFDYAFGADTTSGFLGAGVEVAAKTSGLATYKLVGDNMVQKVGAGDDRFYVIALSNVPADATHNSVYYDWYNAAYSTKINDYATVTSTAFGTGKTNTATMKAAWNASTYGTQNNCSSHSDMWSIDMGDWFVPSKGEWSVLGSELKKVAGSSSYSSITTDAGATISFSRYYWSSSLGNSKRAWFADFDRSSFRGTNLNDIYYVRLASTF